MLRSLRPVGLDNFLEWRRSFESLGYGQLDAARAATSRPLKAAFMQARITHLPKGLRRSLRCVVDVGANEGQWSNALLQLLTPQRVEVFEPNPKAYGQLVKRLAPYPTARVHQLALGSEPGELTLNVTAASNFASMLSPLESVSQYYETNAMNVAEQVPVRVETLDRVTENLGEIDLIKLDVQGFERQVLAGATSALRRARALLIEANFVPHYATEDTFSTMTELLKQSSFELWDLSPPFRAPNGRALWCDAVFIQRSLIDQS